MADVKSIQLKLFISKEKEGLYFNLPFEVPDQVERLDISYRYQRYQTTTYDGAVQKKEVNVIDLALSSQSGEFIGSSGSNRDCIWISEYDSSDGYAPLEPKPGEWNIIAGAYKVEEPGVEVIYEITFIFKERVLLKGDCHLHTTGSDGILSVEEAIQLAKTNKLDFLFVTDHNNYSHNRLLKSTKKLTVLPGVEWTHFKGHANMLGVERPFKGKYYANSIDEVRGLLAEARDNGAIISINHPFDSGCPWSWGLENIEFDCLEIWNGMIKYSDMKCIAWWHGELCKGRRIPIIGGSDFHNFNNLAIPGMPATCVYSMSRGKADILEAILLGHAYVAFQMEAPKADIHCGKAVMGDEIPYEQGQALTFEFCNVSRGDIIKIYSPIGIEKEITCQQSGSLKIEMEAGNKRFYRTEIYRQLLPGLPHMLYLITNPIYFN